MNAAKSNRHWEVLVGCGVLCIFGFALPMLCFGVFVSPLVSHFNSSVTAVNLYFTFMTSAAVASCFVGGRLLESQMKATVIVCAVLMCAVYVLLAAFPAIPLVWVAGIVEGLCYPLCSSVLVPIVINRWFVRRQATFIGVAFALIGVAGVVFGPVLTSLISSFGWRATIIGTGVAMFIAIIFTIGVLVPASPQDVGVAPYGAEASADEEQQSLVIEPTGPAYKKVFGSNVFFLVISASVLSGFLGDFNTQANAIVQQSGFDAVTAGVAFSCVSAGLFAGKMGLSWVKDSAGPIAAFGVGCGAGVVAFILVLVAFETRSTIVLYSGCALAGLCTCLGTIAPALLVRDAFGERAYPRAVAHATAAINLGMAIGAPLYSLTFDLTASYAPVVLACAIVAVVTFALSFAGVRQGKHRFGVEA